MTKTITRKRHIRLHGYDYSDAGWYFITICTANRKCLFGEIIDGRMNLNDSGKMIDEILRTLPEHYDNILMDNYIIMPNHVHAIIIIKKPVGPAQGPAPTGLSLSDIIYRFKSLTTKRYIEGANNNNWQPFNKHVWQRSFYDHIIRTDTSLQNIREYITNNPATWDDDENNIIKKPVGAAPRGRPLINTALQSNNISCRIRKN